MSKTAIMLLMMTPFLFVCATGYHAKSFMGGYSEKKLSVNRYRVRYESNFWTGKSTNQRHLFYRCAELTHEKGCSYFVVEESLKGSAMGIPVGFPVNEVTVQLRKGVPDRNNRQSFLARKVLEEKRAREGK